MTTLESFDIVRKEWGDEVAEAVLMADKRDMTLDDFLAKHCKTCGGNWGAWFLSGVRELWPEVYELIPEYMGSNCFSTICRLIHCLGVWWREDETNA